MSKLVERLEPTAVESARPAAAQGFASAASRNRSTVTSGFSTQNLEEEMVRLHYQLEALLPEQPRQAILFIASREGEGTSTVAREFALTSATRFGRRVLLLEFDRSGQDLAAEGSTAGVEPVQVGETLLRIASVPREWTTSSDLVHLRAAAEWERLRQAYDLIVIDSAPATNSPEGLALVSRVDGVILVLEAETTRWPVAARTRESIVRGRGRVLGVVLNKRRHYIPAFIYNWL